MSETTILQVCNPKGFKEAITELDTLSNSFLLFFVKDFVLSPNQKFTKAMANNKLLSLYGLSSTDQSLWLDSFVVNSLDYKLKHTYFKVYSSEFVHKLRGLTCNTLVLEFEQDFLVLKSGKQEKLIGLEKPLVLR